MKNVILVGLIILFVICCEKEDSNSRNFKTIDNVEISIDGCFTGIENAGICFDSVISDSRCPINAMCIWEGNAVIKLGLKINGEVHSIKLNTSHSFQTDTMVDFIYVSLLELSPYPEIGNDIKHSEYKVKLLVANLNALESNAQVLSFNAEKCGCCWGWTLKMGNDTIKSDDPIIGERVGYSITNPVNVYIELGELEKTCSEAVGIDYYKVKQVVKTK
jgi:hypothetical protein